MSTYSYYRHTRTERAHKNLVQKVKALHDDVVEKKIFTLRLIYVTIL